MTQKKSEKCIIESYELEDHFRCTITWRTGLRVDRYILSGSRTLFVTSPKVTNTQNSANVYSL